MKQKRSRQVVLFAVLSVLVVGFIFWNSMQSKELSAEQSQGLMALLKPVLMPFFRYEWEMHQFVRKAAHFAEFALLGFCLGGLTSGIQNRFWRYALIFFPLFMMLSVAVADEFLQTFSDRSGMVIDIILDFSGGLFGLCVAGLLCALLRRRKKK